MDARHQPPTVRMAANARRALMLALVAALLPAGATGQDTGIFTPAEPGAGANASASFASDRITLRSRLVTVDVDRLALAQATVARGGGQPVELRLNLFADTVLSGIVEGTSPTMSGYALSGRIAGVDGGTLTIVVNREVVAGTVRTAQGTYRIRSAGGSAHVVSRVDESQLPPGAEPLRAPAADEPFSPPLQGVPPEPDPGLAPPGRTAPGRRGVTRADSDRDALVAFYHATGGEHWSNRTNWLSGEPLADWYGVETDANGRVTVLDLRSNNLTGAIPPVLGNLINLWILDLGLNDLIGEIQTTLGNLTGLGRLSLPENHLTGPIPGWVAVLDNVWYLDLDLNRLSGPIPPAVADMKSLRGLRLAFNERLSGPLATGLRQREEFQYLDLRGTAVCLFPDAASQAWLASIGNFQSSGLTCGTSSSAVSTIDLAVFYTPAAKRAVGGGAAIEAVIDLMVAESNRAYLASGAKQQLALVARGEVAYTEVDSLTDLERLQEPEDGYMDEVHAIRDRVGADLVHLIPDRGGYRFCGRANLVGAFGVSGHDCGGRTLVHELGHNMGLNHDRYTQCAPDCNDWPYRHGYGYVNQRAFLPGAPPAAAWITIMAYWGQCDDAGLRCAFPLRFSNPRLTYLGDPLGVPGDGPSSAVDGPADAIRVLNTMRHTMASFRDRDFTNRSPLAVGNPENRTLHVSSDPIVVRVAHLFRDPDGDALTYRARSDAPSIVTARAAGALLTLTPVAAGMATILVTATDAGGSNTSATLLFTVTVQAGTPFTDHEIRPGSTPIRALHFRELRDRIDAVRERERVPRFRWTDPVLAPGRSAVGSVHLRELRRALDEAYEARGWARSAWLRYTDATVTPGVTVIRAVHVMELRAAVLALE